MVSEPEFQVSGFSFRVPVFSFWESFLSLWNSEFVFTKYFRATKR